MPNEYPTRSRGLGLFINAAVSSVILGASAVYLILDFGGKLCG
jgi:hypothetical protein